MEKAMTNTPLDSATDVEKGRPFNRAEFIEKYSTFGIFLILFIVATVWTDTFLTQRNLLNVLRQVAAGTGIMAVGMLFVILTRGIDLSVGSVQAFGSVLCGYYIVQLDIDIWVALPLVLLSGAALGALTGIFVAYLKLPSFVMSLAMMAIARGLSLVYSQGQPIVLGKVGAALTEFGSGRFLNVPKPVWLMIAIFIVAGIVLNYTKYGRIIKAIGSNEEAVRLSGINVPRYVASVYVISGMLAATAGIIAASRTGIGSSQVGVGAELNVIAAVVIGGASLMGGRGGVINTLIGALILGVMTNLMNLAGVPGYHQQVWMGIIIAVAMLLHFGVTRVKN
jgi:ribose transport system permease protein